MTFFHILLLELNILNLQYMATIAGWLKKNFLSQKVDKNKLSRIFKHSKMDWFKVRFGLWEGRGFEELLGKQECRALDHHTTRWWLAQFIHLIEQYILESVFISIHILIAISHNTERARDDIYINSLNLL